MRTRSRGAALLAAARSGAPPGHFTSGACRCAARTMSKPPSGAHEVSSYLHSIGRDDCFHAVVHQGFYTSMDALRGATYEELVECGVRQAHAKLIVSSLGSGAAVSALSESVASRSALESLHADSRAAAVEALGQLEASDAGANDGHLLDVRVSRRVVVSRIERVSHICA